MSQSSQAAHHFLRVLCCVVVAAATALGSQEVAAQEQAEPLTVDLRLLNQPVWHNDASEPLGLRLRVINRGTVPVEGFLLTLAAHPVVSTRSGLHASFEGNAGAILSATSKPFPDELHPGESFNIQVDDPISLLPSLAAVDNGVYPLTLTLSDAAGGVQLDRLTTPLILYPEEPEVPLNLSLILPLNALPTEGPDGTFRHVTAGGQLQLEQAAGESGWLRGLVDALGSEAGELPPRERTIQLQPRRKGGQPRRRTVLIDQQGIRLGLAPTPRFIEELADMADGYRKTTDDGVRSVAADSPTAAAARDLVDRLSELVAEDGIQPLLVPYSFPDIPALARNASERLEVELEEASKVLAQILDVEVSREWLFPPGGRIAAQSLDELRFADADTARYTIFNPDAFGEDPLVPPEGCPQSFASFTCVVSVRTLQGRTIGLIGDDGLQQRFADLIQGSDGRLGLQNFFAETAAIRQELPSIEDRVVQVTMPSLWHPSPLITRRLLAGLRDSPWLQTVTPAEAVELGEPQPRTEDFVQALPSLEKEPPREFFEAIDRTEDLLDSFRRMHPPEQLVERLRRNTLVAESRMWWTSPELLATATEYLDGTVDRVEAEIQKVTIGGPSEINLTSRSGEIPLVVSNGTGFPTTVSVSIRSPQPDLVLDPDSVTPQQIAAEDTYQFTVEANATSSGIFPMEVIVETPDGSLELAYKKITIRSTEFNRIAVGMTVGAFAFLVLFYLMRLARRPRSESAA